METAIVVLSFIQFFVALGLFLIMYAGGCHNKYLLGYIGSALFVAAWLLLGEIALMTDVLGDISGRSIRPLVSRLAMALGSAWFLYGLLRRPP